MFVTLFTVSYTTAGLPTLPMQENGLQRYSDMENVITVSTDTTVNKPPDSSPLISLIEYSDPVLPMTSPAIVNEICSYYLL